MNAINDLIQTTNNLCTSLDRAASDEKVFCQNICYELERMKWESLKMQNDLKQIKEYQGI